MDYRQLRYFRAVVENRSFSAAAKALHMTQPSLSLAVRELEKEFGATLLKREHHGVSLTPEGTIVYETSKNLDEQLEQTKDAVAALRDGTSGSVRLSIAPEYNWSGLAELINHVREGAPSLEITIYDPDPTQSIDNIYQGRADIGIIPNSNPAAFMDRHTSTFDVLTLKVLPLAVAVPSGWNLGEGPLSLSSLTDYPWLIPVANVWFEGLPEILEREWAAAPETYPESVIQVATLQTVLPLVASEAGIAVVPEITETIAPRGVSIYPLANDIAPLTLLAFWNKKRTITPATQRFLDALEELHSEG
ncbi:LysR family transcriptional regulator [Corynebacterium lubricantis]|uniref:LysR family transcriptional regulator n=1 Tax=Corynebacterium lubricantis TaxID=541095 RepID=UPI00036FBEEC|nr:LysR family transcriptional regulator [Corynebacterium lubricantis]